MRNIVVRTILWFVAVPALIAVILLLPYQNHLALNLLVVVASALGATELAQLFERRDAAYRASFITIPLLGAAIPATELLVLNGVLGPDAVRIAIYAVAALVLFLQVFRREDEGFRYTLSNTAANLTLLIYPGLFLSYLIRMSSFPNAGLVVLTFLGVVFFNDTMAYLAGMLYRSIRERRAERRGRTWTPRFVLPVSPNKTVVGFAGGLLMAPLTLLVAHAAFPAAIPGPVGKLLIVGLGAGIATIIGDLIESALKRSATSKDSGSLIPGRGGVLDSIDSVLYAAPAFYYLFAYVI
ncbi:MAG: phosphatidate cytidylyltransferase [Spirochaetota bacterium]